MGPGFDSLGLALELFNEVWVEPASRLSFTLEGEGSNEIPTGPDNLFYSSFAKFYKILGDQPPVISIKMLNRIPLARGLGSSASVIIAGLIAANELSGAKLNRQQLLQMANGIEGHPDNIAAALWGGLTVAYFHGEEVDCKRFEPSDKVSVLMLIPENRLSTEASRAVVPQSLAVQDCVFNISRASLLVGTLITGETDHLSQAIQDKIHQPYRMPLLKDYDLVTDILADAGADAIALSGAGPSMICFVRTTIAGTIANRAATLLSERNLEYSVMRLNIDKTGATASH